MGCWWLNPGFDQDNAYHWELVVPGVQLRYGEYYDLHPGVHSDIMFYRWSNPGLYSDIMKYIGLYPGFNPGY